MSTSDVRLRVSQTVDRAAAISCVLERVQALVGSTKTEWSRNRKEFVTPKQLTVKHLRWRNYCTSSARQLYGLRQQLVVIGREVGGGRRTVVVVRLMASAALNILTLLKGLEQFPEEVTISLRKASDTAVRSAGSAGSADAGAAGDVAGGVAAEIVRCAVALLQLLERTGLRSPDTSHAKYHGAGDESSEVSVVESEVVEALKAGGHVARHLATLAATSLLTAAASSAHNQSSEGAVVLSNLAHRDNCADGLNAAAGGGNTGNCDLGGGDGNARAGDGGGGVSYDSRDDCNGGGGGGSGGGLVDGVRETVQLPYGRRLQLLHESLSARLVAPHNRSGVCVNKLSRTKVKSSTCTKHKTCKSVHHVKKMYPGDTAAGQKPRRYHHHHRLRRPTTPPRSSSRRGDGTAAARERLWRQLMPLLVHQDVVLGGGEGDGHDWEATVSHLDSLMDRLTILEAASKQCSSHRGLHRSGSERSGGGGLWAAVDRAQRLLQTSGFSPQHEPCTGAQVLVEGGREAVRHGDDRNSSTGDVKVEEVDTSTAPHDMFIPIYYRHKHSLNTDQPVTNFVVRCNSVLSQHSVAQCESKQTQPTLQSPTSPSMLAYLRTTREEFWAGLGHTHAAS